MSAHHGWLAVPLRLSLNRKQKALTVPSIIMKRWTTSSSWGPESCICFFFYSRDP